MTTRQTPLVIEWPRPASPPPEWMTRLQQLTEEWADATQRLAVALQPVVTRLADFFSTSIGTMTRAANEPAHVAGLEARYFVRGALDAAYTHPERRDALASQLLAGDDLEVLFMSRENRARVAAAVLAGWAAHRPVPPPLCPGRCLEAVAVGAPEWASCADGVDRCSHYLPEPDGTLSWHRALGDTQVVVTRG